MADNQQTADPPSSSGSPKIEAIRPPTATPSYSRWRTAVHLYFPFVTVALFMVLGSPFDTVVGNVACVVLSAIPTNWLASFFYPPDRPEPTPAQAVRFSRKSDIYRALILFTYRWLFGTPFNLQFFITDLSMSYLMSMLIAERPAGSKQRRSEFGVHILWVAGSAVLMHFSPPILSFVVTVLDRMLWRAAYVALVDDVIGVLSRPNVKTWKGKVTLVLTQALTILFTCWMVLRWSKDMFQSPKHKADFEAALNLAQAFNEFGGDLDGDGSTQTLDDE